MLRLLALAALLCAVACNQKIVPGDCAPIPPACPSGEPQPCVLVDCTWVCDPCPGDVAGQ